MFKPENKLLVIEGTNFTAEKIAFIQNLHDKSTEKINHFDRLRQQLLNFAFIIFSALLAFSLKADNFFFLTIACSGVAGLMLAFRQIDYRYHMFTHGFYASSFVFTQAISTLLSNPDQKIEFYEYCVDGEKTAEWWNLQTKIYYILAVVSVALIGIIPFSKQITATN